MFPTGSVASICTDGPHVADGRTTGEIGAALLIFPDTVRRHLENVFEKLGVRTRTAAVAAVFGPPPPQRMPA